MQIGGMPISSALSPVRNASSLSLLLDLEPGTYVIACRASNSAGTAISPAWSVQVSALPQNALPPGTPLSEVTATCGNLDNECELCLNSSLTAVADCGYCSGGSQSGCMPGERHTSASRGRCFASGGTWIDLDENRELCAAITQGDDGAPTGASGDSSGDSVFFGVNSTLAFLVLALIVLSLVVVVVLVSRRSRHQRRDLDDKRRWIQEQLDGAKGGNRNPLYDDTQIISHLQRHFLPPPAQTDDGKYDFASDLSVVPRQIEPYQITLGAHIGAGQFGEVYKGVIDGHEKTNVALKVLKRDPSPEDTQQFLAEARLMAQFQHESRLGQGGLVASRLKANQCRYLLQILCGSLECGRRMSLLSLSRSSARMALWKSTCETTPHPRS